MTIASSEPSRATALGVPRDQPLPRLIPMPVGYAVMDIGAQELRGPADVLRFVETELPGLGPGDVLEDVHRVTVDPHESPRLRGTAYIAALRGDPGRPRV